MKVFTKLGFSNPAVFFVAGLFLALTFVSDAFSQTEPPASFNAMVEDDVNVMCSWFPPSAPGGWIQWDAGENTGNGIGLTDGGTFLVASRWLPADLTAYDGLNITKMSFYPNGDAAATYVLKAWTGASAGTEIMSQDVATFTVDDFNEVYLVTPITIDASDELWFGYEVTHGASTFPAGCDDGPAVQEYGDQISLDGVAWAGMSAAYGLDYNWNIAAFVEEGTDSYAPVPLVKSVVQNATTSLGANGPGTVVNKFNPTSSKELLGYNVYNDIELVGYTTETFLLHENVPTGTYTYWATAVYDEGESDPSNTVDVTIGPAPTCENFDALTVGGYVAEQLGGNWTTWSGTTGTAEDGLVSDMYSLSPSNAALVEGSTDLVHLITGENITSGKWSYSLNIYVPDGTTGYFNLQKDVVPGTEWGFQVMFEDDMTMIVDGGAAAAAIIPYDYDTWYMCEMIVDLDNDWCEFYVDGTMELEYQWTLGTFGTAGALTLAGSNLFANPGVGGTPPGALFDDICFEDITEDPCENFDDLIVGGYVAEQLGGMWTTWGGTPGGADDAFVSDMYSNSPGNSFVIDAEVVDLIFQFDTDPIATGQWLYSHYIYVPSGFSGYFNVQSEPTPGVDWVIELFFDDGGAGHFAGQSTETFTYDQDTWIFVEVNFDLESGLAQVLFDGTLILEFENIYTIGGIDYFGSANGGTPSGYYDDVCFGAGWEIIGSNPDCEDFDDLTVGGYVAEQLGGMWTTWSGTPGTSEDAFVSDMYSNSPDNSFVVDAGTIDLILQLDTEPITTGQHVYSHYTYIPSGVSGYFNIQSEPTPGVEWVVEVFFNDDGSGNVTENTNVHEFTYTQDEWIFVQINIDLNSGYGQVLFDEEVFLQWMNPVATIGGIDYFGWDVGGTPGAYYDDVCFSEGWEIIVAPPAGPSNLVGPDEIIINNPIELTWDAPGAGEWIHWDSGENTGNGIGLTGGGTFSCASRWFPADLTPYNGLTLSVINFFANGDPDATYVIKAWTGSNGTNEILSQDVASFNVDEWNEVTLTTPIVINASEDLWFGYEVTHGADMFPAATDDGPAIPYNGDMISTGGGWVSMSTDYGLDYNWNIQGWVALADGKVAEPMNKEVQITATSTNFIASGSTGVSNKFAPTNNSKSLDSYNVYRSVNGAAFAVIGNTTETEYTDTDFTVTGMYDYYVTAVWDPEGESDPSNTWTVDVLTSIEDMIFNSTMVYPNPASKVVNIKSDFDITSVKVFNHSGQVIAEEMVHNKMYQFNTSKYTPGLYFFQVETTEGTISKRIIIQ